MCLTRNWTGDFQFVGRYSTHWATPVRAEPFCLELVSQSIEPRLNKSIYVLNVQLFSLFLSLSVPIWKIWNNLTFIMCCNGNENDSIWEAVSFHCFLRKFTYWFLRKRGRERERETEKERETSICCSTYLCIHLLIFVCALTRDQTHNLGVVEWLSDQLSYSTRVPSIY